MAYFIGPSFYPIIGFSTMLWNLATYARFLLLLFCTDQISLFAHYIPPWKPTLKDSLKNSVSQKLGKCCSTWKCTVKIICRNLWWLFCDEMLWQYIITLRSIYPTLILAFSVGTEKLAAPLPGTSVYVSKKLPN